MSLADATAEFRDAVDHAADLDRTTFARRTRNALAQAILAAAFSAEAAPAPGRDAPAADVRDHVGDELAVELVALYGELGTSLDWAGRAIDALEPLHELARP